MRVGGAEPQIAGEREAKAAPDRNPANDGDRRTIEIRERPQAVLDSIAVVARRGGVAVNGVEFGNVGAGAEMRALALDKRDQHVLARLDRRRDRRQRKPHRAGDRVAAVRAVENDAGEGRLEAQRNIGHEPLGTPETTPRPSIALCRLRVTFDGSDGAAAEAVRSDPASSQGSAPRRQDEASHPWSIAPPRRSVARKPAGRRRRSRRRARTAPGD